MPVGLSAPEELLPVKGVRLSSAYAGIRKQVKDDLVLIEVAEGSVIAATFTQNKFCAAPVQLAKKHLQHTQARYLIVNAGNANAGTGIEGYKDAERCCELVAEQFGDSKETVLPFSTGVIAERLVVDKIEKVIPDLVKKLDSDNWLDAAAAIMTTDTVAKGISRQVVISDREYTITGISKGSGMICPNMATMLAYIATDMPIPQQQLKDIHKLLVEKTFNRITVDGDTSTNDAAILIATHQGEPFNKAITNDELIDLLLPVYQHLAQAVIRDGEGATKFVTVNVIGATNHNDATEVAYTVAHSPLVKTALFASDANWGRILAAIGRSKVASLDVNKIDLSLNGTALLQQGKPAASYTEALGAAEMAKEEITITIDLHLSDGEVTIWTSDLSHDYVSINADYRS